MFCFLIEISLLVLTYSPVAKIVSNTDISKLIWYHLIDLKAYFCVFPSDVNFTINTKYLENHNRHLSTKKKIKNKILNWIYIVYCLWSCLNLSPLSRKESLYPSLLLTESFSICSSLFAPIELTMGWFNCLFRQESCIHNPP